MEQKDYEVYVQVPDGPDDITWEMFYSDPVFSDANKALLVLEQSGKEVKLYDPYVGKYFNTNGKEIK